MKKTSSGFSLVELTIALGIASVGLATAVGLLGSSLNSHRLSGEDTALANMSEAVVSDLRSADFDSLWVASPGPLPPATAVPNAPPVNSHYFFSREGDGVNAGDPNAFYECTIRKTADPATRSPNAGRFNLIKLKLDFTYPVPANPIPEKRPFNRQLHATIARY